MPIEVITGLPGHGKTLLLITKLRTAAVKAERPLFAAGIEGLQPGLCTILSDPTLWNSKDESGEFIVPNGSLIFVDEAWKWYGHLHNATGQKTPLHVLNFAEHRHRGLDFVMTTQGPGQLYPFLRNLIEGHTHVVRAMGTHAANLYTWAELNDDVKSRPMREAALRSLWPYPKKEFDTYKSATQHTIKRKIPMRVYLLPLALIGAVISAYLAFSYLRPSAFAAGLTGKETAAGLPAASTTGKTDAISAVDAHKPAAIEEYFANFAPRHPSIPASAPAYDKRRVAAQPQIYCMSSTAGDTDAGHDAKSRCGCTTEQGTPYSLPLAECRLIARNGHAYDPYKQPARQEQRGGQGRQDDQRPATSDSANVTNIETGQVSGYGDLSITNNPGTAP